MVWTKQQVQQQLDVVEALLQQGVSSHRQLQNSVRAATGMSISIQRVIRLKERVFTTWAMEDVSSRDRRRSAAIRRIYAHLRRASGKGNPGEESYVKPNFSALTRFEELLSKIEGTQEPIRQSIELNTVSISQTVMQVIGAMSNEEIAQALAEQQELEALASVAKATTLVNTQGGTC